MLDYAFIVFWFLIALVTGAVELLGVIDLRWWALSPLPVGVGLSVAGKLIDTVFI